MWAFEAAGEQYGIADRELEIRSAAAKRLSQVAPSAGDRLSYTYDFGDDWEHDIVVEAVGDAEPAVSYPRCVAGRRACPPEDCGGIWGYGDLLEILADPAHQEHEDRLEWLGLSSAAGFDPGAFDLDQINSGLALDEGIPEARVCLGRNGVGETSLAVPLAAELGWALLTKDGSKRPCTTHWNHLSRTVSGRAGLGHRDGTPWALAADAPPW
jgi:hypothetical protein